MAILIVLASCALQALILSAWFRDYPELSSLGLISIAPAVSLIAGELALLQIADTRSVEAMEKATRTGWLKAIPLSICLVNLALFRNLGSVNLATIAWVLCGITTHSLFVLQCLVWLEGKNGISRAGGKRLLVALSVAFSPLLVMIPIHLF